MKFLAVAYYHLLPISSIWIYSNTASRQMRVPPYDCKDFTYGITLHQNDQRYQVFTVQVYKMGLIPRQ